MEAETLPPTLTFKGGLLKRPPSKPPLLPDVPVPLPLLLPPPKNSGKFTCNLGGSTLLKVTDPVKTGREEPGMIWKRGFEVVVVGLGVVVVALVVVVVAAVVVVVGAGVVVGGVSEQGSTFGNLTMQVEWT
jgi:hypothetical protein